MIALQPADRVLLIHLGGIGDIILATPALRALRQHYPRVHIAMLVAAHAAQLLDHCPDVDAQWVLASTRAGLDWWSQRRHDADVLRALRDQHVALAVNLYWMYSWKGSLRMAYYLRRIRARASLGYHTDGHGWCFTERIPQSSHAANQQHEAANAMALVQHLGCAPVPLHPQVWLTDDERHWARRQLADWRVPASAPLVVFSPGASHAGKRWPVDRFIAVGRWLATEHGARILLVGDAHDQPLATAVVRSVPERTINRVGRTTVRELLALLALARLVVTNDTGTMHMAAALARPLVALFGPTSPVRFGPLGDPARQRVLQAPTRRINAIALVEVQQAVRELLESS